MISVEEINALEVPTFLSKRLLYDLINIDSLVRARANSSSRMLVYTIYRSSLNDSEYLDFKKDLVTEIKKNGFNIEVLCKRDDFTVILIRW